MRARIVQRRPQSLVATLTTFCLFLSSPGSPVLFAQALAPSRPQQNDSPQQHCEQLVQGTSQNYVEAASWCRNAADAGSASAMYDLGVMYLSGKGLPQSYSDAATWYRKAAGAGNADAMYFLGVLYLSGQGIPQSDADAAAWYRKAADAGNVLAMSDLGSMYASGRGVPKSDADAATSYPSHTAPEMLWPCTTLAECTSPAQA